jgi:hypothetical protein
VMRALERRALLQTGPTLLEHLPALNRQD